MSNAVLRADNLATGYGKQQIVHGVSIEARPGEITCIFGPNGSGKSTVIKAIVGALPAWSGSIKLGDRDLTALPVHEVVRHGLVMMPQGGGVFPRLTVVDNLRMGGFTLAARTQVERRVEQMIDEFPSLGRRRNVPAGSLSGGEQMMLAIARALMPDPSFILLDEPSAGLSPAMVHETTDKIEGLRGRGVGVLMVEQNIAEALPIANKIYVLVGGKVRFSGTPSEIRDDDQLMRLYLGA